MIDTERIATEVANEIIREENIARKKVVIYSGRFQPFHSGHHKTYEHLTDKFGTENVYIGTSDKVSKPRSPFNFKEKKEIMTKMFRIPRDKIVQIKNPYAPKEILKKFNKNETAYVTVVGKKDKGRLGGSYFEDYSETKDLLPYSDKGYVYVAPALSDLSGTDVRSKLGEPSTSDEVKQVDFKKIYGKFDQQIFDLVTDKLTESVVLEWVMERNGKLFEMPKSDVKKVDKYADKQLDPVDVDLSSKHFFQRLNDPRNDKEISKAELIGFFKRLKRNKKEFIEFLNKYKEIVVTDNRSKINIPFMKKANKAIAKTVMRKNDFKTSNVKLTFEDQKEDFDRIEFYENHIKDLIPESFEVIREGNDIKIEVPTKKEASYPGNLGFEEMMKFYDEASSSQIKKLEKMLDRDNIKKAWELVQDVLGVELVGKQFSEGDELEGGLADNMTLSDLADRHDVPLDDIKKEFKMGVKVEMEHTDDKDLSIEITKDHLYEDPKYYTKLKKVEEGIITEGGAYGHMNHPFDLEIDLTFGDLKKIVEMALEGELKLAREKTDGQALAISWRDDKGGLIAARNKSHLKNSGKNAMDISGVKDKFGGRGGLTDAYVYAMKDLEKAISSLSDAQRQKIFQNGSSFMNIEVIFPESVNVIPYGQSLLVFHGTMQYDEDGNAIGENQEAGRILAGMIKQVNQNVQDHYNLQGPPMQELPKSEDLSKKKPKYKKAIDKLQKEFNLSDNDGVGEYHQAWWEDWVEENAPRSLDNKTKMHLVKRWAFDDKSNRINGKTMPDDEIKDWAKKVDKQDRDKIAKKNLQKFENIFLGLGAEVLSYMSSVLTANPDEAVQKIKKELDKTIKDIRKSGDEQKIQKLEKQLKRLEQAGGTEKLVPNEGIVFVYKGKTLKLTGTFAPLNQILGLMYY